MFGITLKKNCPSCNEEVKYISSVIYSIDGQDYTDTFICPNCNEDLAKEEREIIRKARIEGKDIGVIMW